VGLPESEAKHLVAIAGNIERPDLGLGSAYEALAREVGEIYHAAAATRFDLPLEVARRINRQGAEHVLRFSREAHRWGGLSRLHHISTAFVAGDRQGLVAEEDGEGARVFRNTYEQSKWEAECVLGQARDELPITTYRPSIVAGDSRTGRTLHFRVLYQPMKWVYTGQMRVLPCRPEVRLDVVPVDFVCEAILALAREPETIGQTYHLSAGIEKSISIGEIIDISVRVGNEYHAEIGRPPVEPPIVISPDSIEEMGEADSERYRNLFRLAAEFMRTHAPYMLHESLFDSRPSRAILERHGVRCHSLREYLPTLVRYAGERQFEER
jgi:long-chain acyl-CoA synthetase